MWENFDEITLSRVTKTGEIIGLMAGQNILKVKACFKKSARREPSYQMQLIQNNSTCFLVMGISLRLQIKSETLGHLNERISIIAGHTLP